MAWSTHNQSSMCIWNINGFDRINWNQHQQRHFFLVKSGIYSISHNICCKCVHVNSECVFMWYACDAESCECGRQEKLNLNDGLTLAIQSIDKVTRDNAALSHVFNYITDCECKTVKNAAQQQLLYPLRRDFHSNALKMRYRFDCLLFCSVSIFHFFSSALVLHSYASCNSFVLSAPVLVWMLNGVKIIVCIRNAIIIWHYKLIFCDLIGCGICLVTC